MKIALLASAAIIMLTNCALSGNSVQHLNSPNNSEKVMIQASGKPAIEIKYIGDRRQKPPLVKLLFNITLRNDHPQSRWFILPSNLTPTSQPQKGGVDGVGVFELQGQGRVVVGRFQGTAGFQALLLPPNAQVKLRNFPISFWGELPTDSLPLEVVTATQLNIGGEPAQAWFGIDPTSDKLADVSEDEHKKISSKYTPDRSEVPVSFSEENRIKLNVELTKNIK